MGKRLLSFLVICLCAVSVAFAQKKVTGTVVDSETGEPVVGASVLVKGTTAGAATDINGKFTIQNVPNSAKTLVVSYIGMTAKEVAIKPSLKIAMDSDTKALKEQIVVAYGTATKESFTGSAKVVGADVIAETQKENVLDALNGKVAGVQMYNASGQPGAETPTIRIRGISSIYSTNSPLIILDGAPYDGDMNNINPADIESMTVLKDAASNALYGARGANGVIMITTKKGKPGDNAKISIDAKWGSNSRATRRYETINNPAQYYETYYTSLKNYALSNNMTADAAHAWANNNLIDGDHGLVYNVYSVPTGQYLIGSNGKLNPNATMGNVVNGNYLQADDWLDYAFQNGFRQEYNATVTQSTGKTNMYASFGYLDNEGITAKSDYERITARLKADSQILPFLKVGANMNYSHYSAHTMSEDGSSNSSGNIWAVSSEMAPIYPLFIRDANGNLQQDANGYTIYDYGNGANGGLERPCYTQANAIQAALLDEDSYEGNAFNGNMFAEIRFYKDLKFTSNNTVNLDETRSTGLTNAFYGSYASSNGILSKYHTRTLSWNYNQILDWSHDFNGHEVTVMLGHEYYRTKYYYLYASKSNMLTPDNLELAGAVTDGSANSYTTDYNTEGWVGRLQYNYLQKYFVHGSFRRDASSRFHPNHRWGNFWSAGAAWLINKESWFKASWVDMLKIKASYGENGNDGIGNYRYTNIYDIVNADGNIAVVPYTKGSEDISWEKQGNFNAGVEFELFNGRLNGDVEFFYRKTSDMLFSFPLAPSMGYTSYYANIGDMRNRGIEVELDGDIIRTRDLTWNVNVNLTHYTNKITRLPDERKTTTVDGHGGFQSGNYFIGEGLSYYTFYTKQYAGVCHSDNYPGDAADKAAGAGTDYTPTEYDKTYAGRSMWYTTKTVNVVDEEGNVVKDDNGNNVTKDIKVKTTSSSAANYYLGETALPKIYGGFGTSLRYKNFDFSINFAYQLGGKCWDNDYQSMMANAYDTSKGNAWHADMLKAWSETNTSSNIPSLMYNDQYAAASSDRWLTDASYLSINNINIGYTFPRSWTRKALIQKLRIYASADNVFVWSKRQGLDPRQTMSGGGATNTYYPPIRTISGGITIDFGSNGAKPVEPVQTRFVEKEVVKEVPVVKEVVKEVQVPGKTNTVQSTYIVTFAVNSSDIASTDELSGIPEGSTVDVVAYSSPDGNADANMALSQRRADAVADYLKSKGIKVNRIYAKGADSEHANRIAIVTVK